MEHRIYFMIGDVLACVSAGAIGGWLAHSAVAGDLSMLFAMFIGMFSGWLVECGMIFCWSHFRRHGNHAASWVCRNGGGDGYRHATHHGSH